jgi:hypothetical protein
LLVTEASSVKRGSPAPLAARLPSRPSGGAAVLGIEGDQMSAATFENECYIAHRGCAAGVGEGSKDFFFEKRSKKLFSRRGGGKSFKN